MRRTKNFKLVPIRYSESTSLNDKKMVADVMCRNYRNQNVPID